MGMIPIFKSLKSRRYFVLLLASTAVFGLAFSRFEDVVPTKKSLRYFMTYETSEATISHPAVTLECPAPLRGVPGWKLPCIETSNTGTTRVFAKDWVQIHGKNFTSQNIKAIVFRQYLNYIEERKIVLPSEGATLLSSSSLRVQIPEGLRSGPLFVGIEKDNNHSSPFELIWLEGPSFSQEGFSPSTPLQITKSQNTVDLWGEFYQRDSDPKVQAWLTCQGQQKKSVPILFQSPNQIQVDLKKITIDGSECFLSLQVSELETQPLHVQFKTETNKLSVGFDLDKVSSDFSSIVAGSALESAQTISEHIKANAIQINLAHACGITTSEIPCPTFSAESILQNPDFRKLLASDTVENIFLFLPFDYWSKQTVAIEENFQKNQDALNRHALVFKKKLVFVFDISAAQLLQNAFAEQKQATDTRAKWSKEILAKRDFLTRIRQIKGLQFALSVSDISTLTLQLPLIAWDEDSLNSCRLTVLNADLYSQTVKDLFKEGFDLALDMTAELSNKNHPMQSQSNAPKCSMLKSEALTSKEVISSLGQAEKLRLLLNAGKRIFAKTPILVSNFYTSEAPTDLQLNEKQMEMHQSQVLRSYISIIYNQGVDAMIPQAFFDNDLSKNGLLTSTGYVKKTGQLFYFYQNLMMDLE